MRVQIIKLENWTLFVAIHKNKHSYLKEIEKDFQWQTVLFPNELLSKSKKSKHSTLKIFLKFLKNNSSLSGRKFSFVPENVQLIQNITLKDNFLLNSDLLSIFSIKTLNTFSFTKQVKKLENPSLVKLVSELGSLDSYPDKLSKSQLKIFGLLSAIFSNTPYLLLENPEAEISKNTLELFVESLLISMQKNNRKILLCSNKLKYWQHLISHTVELNKKGYFELKEYNSPQSKVYSLGLASIESN